MIIAIKEKDRVVVCLSNTDRWCCLTEKDFVDKENLAINFSKTGKIFALSNMDRLSDILLYDDEFMDLEITPKTIVRDVIPYIKCELKENDKPINEDGNWGNALVICDNERLYDVDPYFGFCEASDYVCHGYKVETIKSVLDQTTSLPAEERILKAVSFANMLHKQNLFPIVITDTKTKQLKNIYKGEINREHIDSL